MKRVTIVCACIICIGFFAVLLVIFPMKEIIEKFQTQIEWISPKNRVAHIALGGSCAKDYLIEIYPDKRVRIAIGSSVLYCDETKTIDVSELNEEINVSVTQEELDRLLNCIDDFINEDLKKIELQSVDPSQNFLITIIYKGKTKTLDGSFFARIDENGNYIQTEAAHNLMISLNEILPVQFDYVGVPY